MTFENSRFMSKMDWRSKKKKYVNLFSECKNDVFV